ncbi:MAG TPA: lipocalin-like domain-containing protein [Coleofasciculaceae cyanobacterium]|jgi:predicted secreted hydrolase
MFKVSPLRCLNALYSPRLGKWGRSSLQFFLIILTAGCLGLTGFASSANAANAQLTWLDAPAETLTGTSAFRQVTAPQVWQFPQDFGAHEDYQTEWWYYTGNLETAAGRPFGFQLTFFRQALMPPDQQPTAPSSHWRSRQVYSAHLTVSDIADRQFYPYERFSRGNVNLAGATAVPYQVWLEDWSAEEISPGVVQLRAQTPEVALDLQVTQSLPPILQGDRGFSLKGLKSGNASYYYSLVQQPTTGKITINGDRYEVTGLTWKDHEYSTNALSSGTVGWNWFSMQFDNGSALMLYLLRHDDGTLESTSMGTYITADGETQPLNAQDWQIEVLDTWQSPQSKAIYPAKWTIAIPELDLTLQGKPLMPNQELNTATATYWEGAVAFQGSSRHQPIQGKGYVELTGYADRLDALLSARTP